jgi:hypothetical protein
VVPRSYPYPDWFESESGSQLTIKPVENGFVVSTVTYSERDPEEDFEYLPEELKRTSVRREFPKTRQFVFTTSVELLAWLGRHLTQEA